MNAVLKEPDEFTGAVAALDGLIQQAIKVRNERNALRARAATTRDLLEDVREYINCGPAQWGKAELLRRIQEVLS